MLPESYDNVSEETKTVVQLFLARAIGFLQGSGHSDEEARIALDGIEKEATRSAVEMAVEAWEKSRKSCSAERFVQWFADLVWEAATGDGQFQPLFTTTNPSRLPVWHLVTILTWFQQKSELGRTSSLRL